MNPFMPNITFDLCIFSSFWNNLYLSLYMDADPKFPNYFAGLLIRVCNNKTKLCSGLASPVHLSNV